MIKAEYVRKLQEVDVDKQLEGIEDIILLAARKGFTYTNLYVKNKFSMKVNDEIYKQLRIAGYHVSECAIGQRNEEEIWVRVSW